VAGGIGKGKRRVVLLRDDERRRAYERERERGRERVGGENTMMIEYMETI
jgi:hypothetical protein